MTKAEIRMQLALGTMKVYLVIGTRSVLFHSGNSATKSKFFKTVRWIIATSPENAELRTMMKGKVLSNVLMHYVTYDHTYIRQQKRHFKILKECYR